MQMANTNQCVRYSLGINKSGHTQTYLKHHFRVDIEDSIFFNFLQISFLPLLSEEEIFKVQFYMENDHVYT